ncbi:MAG: hypothetical protein S4CHLAM81_12560 [Chlamydiales bacterium]|nr:hypothetical protein [Chlamydiales bacterium]MCH9636031.1 hypothetical protein [Chlamydiales bacterium]
MSALRPWVGEVDPDIIHSLIGHKSAQKAECLTTDNEKILYASIFHLRPNFAHTIKAHLHSNKEVIWLFERFSDDPVAISGAKLDRCALPRQLKVEIAIVGEIEDRIF